MELISSILLHHHKPVFVLYSSMVHSFIRYLWLDSSEVLVSPKSHIKKIETMVPFHDANESLGGGIYECLRKPLLAHWLDMPRFDLHNATPLKCDCHTCPSATHNCILIPTLPRLEYGLIIYRVIYKAWARRCFTLAFMCNLSKNRKHSLHVQFASLVTVLAT